MLKPNDFPYCGQSPLPGALMAQWNLDIYLLLSMATLLAIHTGVLARSGELHAKSRWVMAVWLMLAALFVSPLCALSSALFSVRVLHHVMLIALVAPAIIMALPDRWRAMPFPRGTTFVFLLNIATI